MPLLAPKSLDLNETERNELQQLVNRHSTPQQLAIRAKIILLADSGNNHRQIARELDISLDMARTWRNRWLELQHKDLPAIERLKDAERSGEERNF